MLWWADFFHFCRCRAAVWSIDEGGEIWSYLWILSSERCEKAPVLSVYFHHFLLSTINPCQMGSFEPFPEEQHQTVQRGWAVWGKRKWDGTRWDPSDHRTENCSVSCSYEDCCVSSPSSQQLPSFIKVDFQLWEPMKGALTTHCLCHWTLHKDRSVLRLMSSLILF